jgi:hypothetical protein
MDAPKKVFPKDWYTEEGQARMRATEAIAREHCVPEAEAELIKVSKDPLSVIRKMRKVRRFKSESLDGFVYFLVHKKEIVYVGQTIQLTQRIGSHKKDKTFDHALYFKCNRLDMDRLESALIAALMPQYNRVGLEPSLADYHLQYLRMYGFDGLIDPNHEKHSFMKRRVENLYSRRRF